MIPIVFLNRLWLVSHALGLTLFYPSKEYGIFYHILSNTLIIMYIELVKLILESLIATSKFLFAYVLRV
jgi:hypothetical protein